MELIFFILVLYIRKNNQWLITNKDKKPVFDESLLKKIFLKSYDPFLGWDRKANTSGFDKNGKNISKWSINKNGARNNLEYNDKVSFISIYGDSFSFAREVNDNETWGYLLSNLLNSNVENFAVGNFGFDQALLKLERKLTCQYYRPKIVIIGVVPDTISRILSLWKHYYEYGNIFGFKPRYILRNDEIHLINNYMDHQSKFYEFEKYLEKIQKNDFFYKNKFLKEIIVFPYSLHFLKNYRRNFQLVYETLKGGPLQAPPPSIMKGNLNYRVNLYKDEKNIKLLVEELKIFDFLSRKYKFKPYFLMIPQKDDVNYIKKTSRHFYKNLIGNIPKHINYIDFYDFFKNYPAKELNLIYSEDTNYGGHLNSKGNKIIAKVVNRKIQKSIYDI